MEKKRGIKITSEKNGRHYITAKHVLDHAKTYWNCDHVYGVPLEDNGNN